MDRALATLPDDLQTLLFELFDLQGLVLPVTLPLRTLPLRRFPDLGWDELAPGDERGPAYARAMAYAPNLPPVLISGTTWLDGRHRVWAARYRHDAFIDALDLTAAGITARGWSLLP
jgi:hypothetical protein